MSKSLPILITAVLLCAAPAAESQASIQVGDLVKIGDGLGSPGGISLIDDLNDPGSPDFDSFCVEITEFIDTINTFAVQNIGLVTDHGGKTLSSYTAWLYNRYLDRTVNGFNATFNATNLFDVNALQLAIWKGMGYTSSEIMTQVGASWYLSYDMWLGSKPWQSQFAADASWSGVGNIRVMNLRKVGPLGIYTDYAQDQLVRLPPTSPAPEPLSLMVWSLLGCCVGAARFRRTR